MNIIVSSLDTPPEASRLSAKAQNALETGDTDRARELHQEAAEILRKAIPGKRKQTDKHFLRYLAATQYFLGGHYAQAKELCQKIQVDLLPQETRTIYRNFLRDVKERASSKYILKTRQTLEQYLRQKKYQKIIELLQKHPFVLSASEMALLRGLCCEELEDYHAAALFYADAVSFNPKDINAAISAATLPLELIYDEKFPEADRVVEKLLRLAPHALTSANAAILRFHQAVKSTELEQQKRLWHELILFYEDAWKKFNELLPSQRKSEEVREIMSQCLEMAAIAFRNIGNQHGCIEACNRGVELNPTLASARVARGINTYPSDAAIEDFHLAIQHGAQSYFPYYFLAHAALGRDDFQQAISWGEQALRRKPSPKIEAQLWAWLAICHSMIGSDLQEVRQRFKKALELDPDDPQIRHNVELFEEFVSLDVPPSKRKWEKGKFPEDGKAFVPRLQEATKALVQRRHQNVAQTLMPA